MKYIVLFIALSVLAFPQDKKEQPVQDTVRVSLSALDQEIAQREDQLKKLLQDIEQANKNVQYLAGAVDMLKQKRAELTPAPVQDKPKTDKKGK